MYKIVTIILLNFILTTSIHILYKLEPSRDINFAIHDLSDIQPLYEYNEESEGEINLETYLDITDEPLWFNKNQISYNS